MNENTHVIIFLCRVFQNLYMLASSKLSTIRWTSGCHFENRQSCPIWTGFYCRVFRNLCMLTRSTFYPLRLWMAAILKIAKVVRFEWGFLQGVPKPVYVDLGYFLAMSMYDRHFENRQNSPIWTGISAVCSKTCVCSPSELFIHHVNLRPPFWKSLTLSPTILKIAKIVRFEWVFLPCVPKPVYVDLRNFWSITVIYDHHFENRKSCPPVSWKTQYLSDLNGVCCSYCVHGFNSCLWNKSL